MKRQASVRRQVGLPPRPTRWLPRLAFGVVGVVALWALLGLEFKWSRLLEAPADVWAIIGAMYRNFDPSAFPQALVQMAESITMAWLGTLIAAVFAGPLAFMAAENMVGKPVAIFVRQILNLLRAVPEIILVLAFIPVLGLSPVAGVVAIGIGSIGSLGKLFYELIEGVKPGPIEGVTAVGANFAERLRWGVVPQVSPELASLTMYRFEVNIRASAVLGVLGAGGIGEFVTTTFEFKQYGQAAVGLIVMIGGTIIVDVISGWIRRRIIAGPTVSVAALSEPPAGGAAHDVITGPVS